MASLYAIPVLVISVVLQTWNASADILAPIFSPNLDNVCRGVACGKGICKSSNDSIFGFECECAPGWKQAFKFLPCVIPNCTLNYSCGRTPAPAVNKRNNKSFFDPCHWADCGVGLCNKTSALTYVCDCNDGYFNLLNVKAFPCLKQCALGIDCGELGINSANSSTPPPSPSSSDNSSSKASLIVGGGFDSLIVIAALLAAMFLLK